jgi:general secretion pathway protein J
MIRRQQGFTLIEVVIAVLITAILFTMAYGAIQQALANRERLQHNSERLRALQFTMRSLVQDFTQLAPRPVREPTGDGYQPALQAGGAELGQVLLTRGGWMNPIGAGRSTLQRVRYRVDDGKFLREHWLVLDAMFEPAPIKRELLDQVRSFSLRFLSDGRNWQDSWPPASLGPSRSDRELRWRPIAVEVTLELEDWGRVTRIIEVPG